MQATAYAKLQIEQAFNVLNGTAQGMDEAQYNWKPDGTCNPIGKNHVHVLTSIDFFLGAIAEGKPAVWQSFAAEHGMPSNPLEIWGYSGTIPIDAVNAYGRQVQQSALDYVSSLSDADLDRQLDTRFFGTQSLGFLIQLAGMHTAGHVGDIAAVKGIQGLKGLPF